MAKRKGKKNSNVLSIKYWKDKLKAPKVAVLRLSGIISSSGGMKSGISFDEVEKQIDKAFNTPRLKAVALLVNSPGGSPVQSELIANRIKKLSKENNIPVYSFAEDVAASGGYWLLCAGEEIYAHNSSIIGSIGVISSGFGFVDAIKKMGIERRIYAQGNNKAILDPFSKEKPEDVKIFKDLMKIVHESFKDMVRDARGNKIKKKDETKLFSGEFWCGKQALDLGLIDAIGDMHSVMEEKFGKDIDYIKITKPESWLKRKFGIESIFGKILATIEERLVYSKFGL